MKCYDITVDVDCFGFCVLANSIEEAREKAQAKINEFSVEVYDGGVGIDMLGCTIGDVQEIEED